jgi:hypothetical protein
VNFPRRLSKSLCEIGFCVELKEVTNARNMFFENLIIAQLVKVFKIVYGSRFFITVFTTA